MIRRGRSWTLVAQESPWRLEEVENLLKMAREGWKEDNKYISGSDAGWEGQVTITGGALVVSYEDKP